MGRNKKAKKAKHDEVDDSHSDADSEVSHASEVYDENQRAGATEGDAPPAADVDAASEADSDDKPKKKKEYKGNRLEKMTKGKNKGKKGEGKSAVPEMTSGQAADGASDDEEEVVVTRQYPVEVLYCAVCTFPAEMCEFSGMMEKCRPWLQENAAELADAEERGRKRRILTEKDRLEALIEGRGIKKALERVVVIEVEQRTGRRVLTSVFGMDLFGFNMKDLSRDWKKIFACGAGVRAAEEGKHQDCIDIQGNVIDRLAEMLVTKYKISKDAIFTLKGKKKVPYFED